ncbi:type II secretion system protein M [Pseudomaricurvus alkylphenolicus]|jgi:type II secretory pathway component PulM|uniref:type II secretion system protein GspM n=1 Tax=Pseudomaricurvus alkylphenolicus TaxID=1306991 RepID=UPI00141E4411|nr:type II secretion system protein GspM [Pseudomaricurvus alkylphenolicus]NIB41420.1 type II secretion system protein M [Pseudomaricurvus alkylphenolicus]
MSPILTWWQQRTDSEQRTLKIASPIILSAVFYLLVFAPLYGSYASEKKRLEQLKSTYLWLAENSGDLAAPYICQSVDTTSAPKEALERLSRAEGIAQSSWTQTHEGWSVAIKSAQGRSVLRWLEASACVGASITHVDIQRVNNHSPLVNANVGMLLL